MEKENNNRKNDNHTLVDILLVVGIVTLAINNSDAWGWLLLVLILRNL